jgi:hypothetical protein
MTNNEEVVVRAARGITAVTWEELGAELTGPTVDVPEDIQEDFQPWLENYKAFLSERTQANMRRMAAEERGPRPQAGGFVTPTGYECWDIMTVSPIQWISPPGGPYLPHKIIAAGEWAALLAVMFVNAGSPAPGIPPCTSYLGSRPFRVRFEQINLTNVTDGPDFTFTGTFPSSAPVISLYWVWTRPTITGPNPSLMELNVTADITHLAQPIAAFGTHHLDIEADPGWPRPEQPGLRSPSPNRYLVYPK